MKARRKTNAVQSPAPAPPCSQAVILAGGEGTRMRPITSRTPKPVTPLVERPFVAYQLERLARHGVRRAVLATGYLSEVVTVAVGDGSAWGLDVRHITETRPLGTAGAVAHCVSDLDPGPFFVLNGDVLSDIDFSALAATHLAAGRAATLCLTRVADPRRYGVVTVDEDGAVLDFLEKPGSLLGPALINAGVYVLERRVLLHIPRGLEASLERGVFPRLASDGDLQGFTHAGYWRDVGTPTSYLKAHADVLSGALETSVRTQLDDRRRYVAETASVASEVRLVPPVWIGEDAVVDAGARVGPFTVVGGASWVREGARVSDSVLQVACVVGAGAEVDRSTLVRGASVGAGARIVDAVLGEASHVGSGARPAPGLRLQAREVIPEVAGAPEDSRPTTPASEPPPEPSQNVLV